MINREILSVFDANDIKVPDHLLKKSLTHKSVLVHRETAHLPHNDDLIFIGESLIELFVNESIYQQNINSKQIYQLRNLILGKKEQIFADAAISCGLDKHIILGKSEQTSNQSVIKQSILAACLKAILAILFVHSDYNRIAKIMNNLLKSRIQELVNQTKNQDLLLISNPKGKLQEITQEIYKILPEYKSYSEGIQHELNFFAEVLINGTILAKGSGDSRKKAESEAARKAVLVLNSSISSEEGLKVLKPPENNTQYEKKEKDIKTNLESSKIILSKIELEINSKISLLDEIIQKIKDLEYILYKQNLLKTEYEENFNLFHSRFKTISSNDLNRRNEIELLENIKNNKKSFVIRSDLLNNETYSSNTKINEDIQFVLTSIKTSKVNIFSINEMKIIEQLKKVFSSIGHFYFMFIQTDASWLTPLSFFNSTGYFKSEKVESLIPFQEIIFLAQNNTDLLFTILLLGANRAPTECYLNSFLKSKLLNIPWVIGAKEVIIPQNLIIILQFDQDACTSDLSEEMNEHLKTININFRYADYSENLIPIEKILSY